MNHIESVTIMKLTKIYNDLSENISGTGANIRKDMLYKSFQISPK